MPKTEKIKSKENKAKKIKAKESKEDKISKILNGISLMDDGETITPTALAKKIGCHPDSLRTKLDELELAKKIGFRTIYDETGFARLIIKEEGNVYISSQLASIQKELIDMKTEIHQIKCLQQKIKKDK